MRKAKHAEKIFECEQGFNSRLFVIDVGVDLKQLRVSYPDRVHYAIVYGLIRLNVTRIKNEKRVGGFVSKLNAENINVPLSYRSVFNDKQSYEVDIAFGRRLEPWLVVADNSSINNKP